MPSKTVREAVPFDAVQDSAAAASEDPNGMDFSIALRDTGWSPIAIGQQLRSAWHCAAALLQLSLA